MSGSTPARGDLDRLVAPQANRLAGAALSLLRIVAGALFLCHGAMKLLGWFGGMPASPGGGGLPPLLVVAGWIELVGGTAIMLGLLTRPVAFITAGEMAVAYFHAHFPHGFWPIKNHGELPILFCFIFLLLVATGGGPFSLDHLIRRRGGSAPANSGTRTRAARR
jgi:putative oxidoreductase